MTTDVINGVPRDDLDLIRAVLEGFNPCMARDDALRTLRRLLATAQPAADGEREAFEAWAASVGYHTERDMFQREKYQSSLTWELWRVWQARAAQPQQAVAVTDAMVLAARGVCVSFRGHYGEHNDYLDDCTARQIIDAALSAHKTGEEE